MIMVIVYMLMVVGLISKAGLLGRAQQRVYVIGYAICRAGLLPWVPTVNALIYHSGGRGPTYQNTSTGLICV